MGPGNRSLSNSQRVTTVRLCVTTLIQWLTDGDQTIPLFKLATGRPSQSSSRVCDPEDWMVTMAQFVISWLCYRILFTSLVT